MRRDVRRGIHLPPKVLQPADYEALGTLHPGAVVLLSAQLGEYDPLRQVDPDPQLQLWLSQRQDVLQVVRMWPVKQPDDPHQVAARIVALHRQYPWVHWFIPANEPDVEWPDPSWEQIARWTTAVWSEVDWYRTQEHVPDLHLLFPPLSQQSRLDPERVGYDKLREAIQLYLDRGDGIAGHEYWDRGNVFLAEDTWPDWLRNRLGAVPFFVTEAGRRPGPANGVPDLALGQELVEFAGRTRAEIIAPFVLSSPQGQFDQQDLVDSGGRMRPPLYVWGAWPGG